MAKPSPWGGEPERLEPCAHCGSTETPDVQVGHQGSVDEPYYYVTCKPCDATVGWSKNRAEAIAAWNRRTPSQSREPAGYSGYSLHPGNPAYPTEWPSETAEILWGLNTIARDLSRCPQDRMTCALAAQLIRDQIEMLAEFDAAPVTDARIEKLRETIEVVVGFMVLAEAGIMPMAEALESAVKCARIALGEREP